MLRLYDPRSGSLEEPPAGRPLRVHVHGPSPRAHVTADLLRRVAERRGPLAVLISRDDIVLGWDEAELNIPPAEVRADPATDPAVAAADVHVVDGTAGPTGGNGGSEGADTLAGHQRYLVVPLATGDRPATA